MFVQIEGLTAWVHSALLSDDLEKERFWPEMNVVLATGATVELRRHSSAGFVATPHHVGWLGTTIADFMVTFSEPVAVDQALDLADQLGVPRTIGDLLQITPLR